MCLFLCQYHTVLITIALKYSLKSRNMIPPALFLFLDCFDYLGAFVFPYKFKNFVFWFCEKVIGNLIGIALSL